MNIVYLTTEAVPFAKTGGLADVCGALPIRIAELGHNAAVIMPAFRSIHDAGIPVETTDISFAVSMGEGKIVGARLLRSKLPESDVDVWFIDQPTYYDRDSLYGSTDGDYVDNAERFTFFSRAAIAAIGRIGFDVDVVHCNDWQSGLVPALMKVSENEHPWVKKAATVFTIHNLAYQGSFPPEDFKWTGLSWEHFTHESFEFYHRLNFLKTGIVSSDVVSTVSPQYAKEICQPEQGCGLDPILSSMSDRVFGITNGIDPTVWNPSIDSRLTQQYDVDDWKEGKLANKQSLQKEFGLKVSQSVEDSFATPMIGLVGRLAEQKGWDLIVPVLRRHMEQNRTTQWIVLGSGDARIENELRSLAAGYHDRFALHVGFSDALAHRIEAGSDLFVMPSQYEPCGLNQLYSLRYGTVPIVTRTGGLADTVVECTQETLVNWTATGFFVDDYSVDALDRAIGNALQLRYHDRRNWEKLVQIGMKQDWSWGTSAGQYVSLYEDTISLKAKTSEKLAMKPN